jgi:hypothetical protein
VIAGGSWPLFQTLDATTAEALALRHGLLLLEEIGYSPTVVKSDCLELINNCSGETEVWGPHAHILPDCLHISRRISNISFKHCLREANKVAHNLARLSFDSNSFSKWDASPPLSVLADALNDVTLK